MSLDATRLGAAFAAAMATAWPDQRPESAAALQPFLNSLAIALVAEITGHAHAIISTSTVAGRMPASTTQHTAIEGPASDVALAIT